MARDTEPSTDSDPRPWLLTDQDREDLRDWWSVDHLAKGDATPHNHALVEGILRRHLSAPAQSQPAAAAAADAPPETDEPTVCIAHGAFIPCRRAGEHRYTANPYWVKSVQDYHGSSIPGLTWEPAWEHGRRDVTA